MDWLPEDHLAYFILDVVTELDLSAVEEAIQAKDSRGERPYSPRMMTALLLYGYATGVFSSRKIEHATYADVAFRLLAGGCQPHFTRISAFRRDHLDALKGLFVQVVRLCQRAGLVKLGHVAIDGTKVKASASKHKAMSYDRMKEKEAELSERVRELLEAAEAADRIEEESLGPSEREHALPEDLRHAQRRLEKIRAAKAELEAEAKMQGAERVEPPHEPTPPGPTPLPHHRIPTDSGGTPAPKAQRNFTDAESRIQKTNDGFIQGFNCQAAVDDAHQVIIAEAVTNQPPDAQHLVPVLERAIETCGAAPAKTTADAGYFSESNITRAEALGTDPLIATGRTKRGRVQAGLLTPSGPGYDPPNPKQLMSQKLATTIGAALYARRKATVEPVFGQIKQIRGFRQFLLRGLAKVRGEWTLICLTHNLLKLYRAAPA